MQNKITSVNNPAIIEFSKLRMPKVRFLTGLFSVEGEKSLRDILDSDVSIKNIFVTEDYKEISDLPHDLVTIVSNPVMKKLSSSDTPPKVITIAYQRNFELEEILMFDKHILLDGISDPGNLGTIIRSAAAFGFEAVLMINNCVDVYNSKVIRSSAGNFFKMPFFTISDVLQLKKFSSYQFIMSDLHSDEVYSPSDVPVSNKLILVMGSEAEGISKNVLDISHSTVKIDTKNVESLNVASASAIIMYELSKRF